MPKINPPPKHHNLDPLDQLAVQVRAILKRKTKDNTELGKILQQAFEQGEFGQGTRGTGGLLWKEWIEREFDMSEDTAMNYRNLYRLSQNPNGSGFLKLDITNRALYRLAGHFLDHDELQEEIIKQVKKAAEKGRVTLHTVRYIIKPPYCSQCKRNEEEVEAAGYVMIKPTCHTLPFCTECVERAEAATCSQCAKSGKDVGVFGDGTEGLWRIDGKIFCNSCKENRNEAPEEEATCSQCGKSGREGDRLLSFDGEVMCSSCINENYKTHLAKKKAEGDPNYVFEDDEPSSHEPDPVEPLRSGPFGLSPEVKAKIKELAKGSVTAKEAIKRIRELQAASPGMTAEEAVNHFADASEQGRRSDLNRVQQVLERAASPHQEAVIGSLLLPDDDDKQPKEERWQNALGGFAGSVIAMRDYWKKEFGDWEKFDCPPELATLVKEAKQAWDELEAHLDKQNSAVKAAADRAEAKASGKLH